MQPYFSMPSLTALFLWIPFVFAMNTTTTANYDPSPKCKKPAERREWRNLTDTERLSYINAVRCLQSLPSTAGIMKEAKSRYDDFVATHIVLADEIHSVGQFLPWHRLFVHLFEKALKEECGYKGAHPYWNWSLDVKKGLESYASSPLFHQKYGFGGNGMTISNNAGMFNNWTNIPGFNQSLMTGGGPIQDGPFASSNLSLGPGRTIQSRRIHRAFGGSFLDALTENSVAGVKSRGTDFWKFHNEIRGWPAPGYDKPQVHSAAHFSVGGDMGDVYSSPADPLFWPHHANIDRIWWEWQKENLNKRLFEVGGPTDVNNVFPPYRVPLTLDFVLKTEGLGEQVEARQVMDTRNDYLCYMYL